MAIVMIGTIRSDFKHITLIRLFDTDTKQVKDCLVNAVIAALNTGNLVIENLAVKNGELDYICGNVERYPKFLYGIGIIDKSPVTILKQYLNNDYLVVNGAGEEFRIGEDELIRYSYQEGISNATVVERNDTKYIRSISGEFEKETPVDYEKKQKRMAMKTSMFGGYADFIIKDDGLHWMNKNSEKVLVPKGVTRISDNCFANMAKLKTLKLPDSVQELGAEILHGDVLLKSFEVPSGVKELNGREFVGSSLETITIPNGIQSINRYTFISIPHLKKVIYSNRLLRDKIVVKSGVKRELV